MTPFTTPGFAFRFDRQDDLWLVTVGTKAGPIAARFEQKSTGYRWLTEVWAVEAAVAAARA